MQKNFDVFNFTNWDEMNEWMFTEVDKGRFVVLLGLQGASFPDKETALFGFYEAMKTILIREGFTDQDHEMEIAPVDNKAKGIKGWGNLEYSLIITGKELTEEDMFIDSEKYRGRLH